jgi:hypothetical protein
LALIHGLELKVSLVKLGSGLASCRVQTSTTHQPSKITILAISQARRRDIAGNRSLSYFGANESHTVPEYEERGSHARYNVEGQSGEVDE